MERISSLTNGIETTGYPHEKKANLNPYFIACIKINSKWITDLWIKAKTI